MVAMQNLPLFLVKGSIVLTLLVTLLLVPIVSRNEREVMLLIFGAIALAVTAWPMFLRKDYNLFEPLTFVAGLVLTGVTAKLLYIVAIGQDRAYIIRRLLLYDEPSVLLYGTIVTVCGLGALAAGYNLRLPRIVSPSLFVPTMNNWSLGRMYLVVGLLFIFSGLCFAGFIATAGVSASSLEGLSAKRFSEEAGSGAARINSTKYYLYRGAALSKFVFYLALAWTLYHRKPWLNVMTFAAVIALIQTVALSFVMSSRASVVLILLDASIIYYLFRGRIEIQRIVLAGIVSIGLLIVMAASRSSSDQTMGELIEKTFAGRDMLDVSKSAHIINAVPSRIDYRYGETLYGWLVAPIPRSMWENKPMWAERGTFLMREVFGDKGGLTGMPPGMLAEFYWNFGWAGVLIGMFVMGVLFRQLFVTFDSLPRSPTSVLIYTMILTRLTIFSLGTDFGTGFLKAGLDVVPLVLMFFLFTVGTSRSGMERSSLDGEAGDSIIPHAGHSTSDSAAAMQSKSIA